MAGEKLEQERARFDERYSAPGYHYGTEPNQFVAAQKHLLKRGQRALVPGDGEGRNGVWLAEQGLEVTCFDPSPVGMDKARQLGTERGVKVDAQVGDFASWVWPEKIYDVVVLTYVHVAPEIRKIGHGGVWWSIKPGGLVILEGFSPRQLEMKKHGATGGPKDRSWLFSLEMMRADFSGADFLVLEDADDDFQGATHSGRCAVMRVVGRKPG